MQIYNRRQFIKVTAVAGGGLALPRVINSLNIADVKNGLRVGIIGLDTSHSFEFTRALNNEAVDNSYSGYKVVAAYPKGSNDIQSAVKRIQGYTEDVKKLGVTIVNSIDELLTKVDVVLLETNDGRLHLQQAIPVLKARKKLFIDKPVAASLHDAMLIYKAAKQYQTPVFSSSALRYMDNVQAVVHGKVGKVLGADTFCPATLEKTHPDFFWYGIHGIEMLFTVMGPGCKTVTRTHTNSTDIVVGVWDDGRIGSYRGTRTGPAEFGGTVYGTTANAMLGPFTGYKPLLNQIITFFNTGIAPVTEGETLEILAFMEAADESKLKNGSAVSVSAMMQRAAQPNQ